MTTPTPAGTMAAGTALPPGSSSASGSSPGASPIAVLSLEVVGVVAFAILASIGPRTGKVIALFMAGLLVLWLVLNASTLKRLIPGTNVAVQG